MKSLVGIVGAGALFVSAVGTASAVDQRDWRGPTSGTSIAAPASWSEPTNWADSTPPSKKTDIANFGSMPNNIFVALPSALTLGALHQTGNGTVHLLGGKLTVDSSGWSGNGGAVAVGAGRLRNKVYVWADVTATDNFSGQWSVVGDMFVKGQLTSSIGSQYWRGYLYANSASEDRSNAFYVSDLNNSSSACSFIAPHGTPARDSEGWSQTAESALVSFVGTTIGRIAPGCRVSGPGIPEGTFLKRYYEGFKLIELSQPVMETIPSNTLHFDAYSPTTTGYIKTFQPSSNSDQAFQAYMSADAGTFTVYIGDYWLPKGRTMNFNCGTYPAQLVISNSVNAAGAVKFRYNSNLFFTSPASGTAGLAKVENVQFTADSGRARIGVEEGVSAVYTNITATASAHSIVKYGAGSLRLDFADALTSVASPLTVEEGTLAVAPRAASVQYANVSIAAGATFKVASGTAKFAAFTAESGATIEAAAGATVDLSSFSTLPAGLKLTGSGQFVLHALDSIADADVDSGVELRFAVEGEARGFKSLTAVTPAVVGEPAFWVDASKNVTTFSTNGVNYKGVAFSCDNLVSCWRDCRYEDDPVRYGVYYATNDLSGVRKAADYGPSPAKLKTRDGFKAIDYTGNTNFARTATGFGNYRWVYGGMTWSKPITGIRAVFAVTYQNGQNAQAILGGTTRAFPTGYGDFTRGIAGNALDGGGTATPNAAHLFSVYASDCVKDGWVYAEGIKKPWDVCVYQANSIEIRESHPLAPGGKADAFAIQDYGGYSQDSACSSSGSQEHYEVLIYTNELTMAEREQVYAYLAKKYLGQTNAGTTSGDLSRYEGNGHVKNLALSGDKVFKLNVGDVMFADQISGEGALVKTGEGKFYADLVEGASLTVSEGEMIVHSAAVPSAYDQLPADHFVHWDAANTNNMDLLTETVTIKDGFDEAGNAAAGYSFTLAHTNLVNHWYDARFGKDGKHIYGTGRKSSDYRTGWLVTNQLNGLPAVDYGPIFNYKTNMDMHRRYFHEFHLTDKNEPIRSNPITAMFMVKNAAGGGNQVLGDTNNGYGISRSAVTTDYTKPIVNVSGIKATLNGVTVNPAATGYTGGWDQLSLYCLKTYSGNLIGANTPFTVQGGQKIGEVLIYTNALGWADARAVDAYLGNKWFNRTMPYAAPSSVGTLSVAAGATLTVEGGAPLAVSSLQPAGGTINGALTLAADAVIDVYITETGTIAAATVTGAVDLSAGGTIIVHGDPLLLAAGDYRLVSTTGLAFDAAKWTVTVENPTKKRIFSFRSDAQGLVLGVTKPGAMILIR